MSEWVSIKEFAEIIGTSVEFVRTIKDREAFIPYRKYIRKGAVIHNCPQSIKVINAYKNRDFSCDYSKARRIEMGV